MLRSLLTIMCVFLTALVYAQCSIKATSQKVCLGATTTFSSMPLSAADSLWKWNFGDGGSSNQASPSYQYQSAGVYTVTLRKYIKGGTFCDASAIPIIVVNRPVSKFINDTVYKQCFRNNRYAFTDLSQPGLSGAPIQQRTMLYEDGDFVIQQAPFSGNLPHHYLNPAGGRYKIVLEVKDTNGCADQYLDSVLVHPAMRKPGLTASLTNECHYTDVLFTHNGFYNQANTSKVTWIPGDGDTLYAPPFNSLLHKYSAYSANFSAFVFIKDTNGCENSDTVLVSIKRNKLDTVLIINDPVQCLGGNKFDFSNGSANTTRLKWTLSNSGFYQEYGNNSFTRIFNSCGPVNVQLELENGTCRFVKDTQVMVMGHALQIGASPLYQCVASDTVKFTNSYFVCDTVNSKLHFLWNFRDNFAPPCTTSTRNGINVAMNCNFSTDEKDVSHFYSQQSVKCYLPGLTITDSTSGCVAESPTRLNIVVSDVDMGWDSSLAVPRRGVYYEYDLSDSCSNKVKFVFDVLPACGPEKMYILHDSLCFPHDWKDLSLDTLDGWVDYENKCTPGSLITYGVIGRVGSGANTCFDTAWYTLNLPRNKKVKLKHRVLRENTCKPFDVAFEIPDSMYTGVEEITCDFGDNTLPYEKKYLLPADSILESFFHVYQKPGIYPYEVLLKFKTGCYKYLRDTVHVGKYTNLINMKPKVCFPDSVSFKAYPSYYGRPGFDFWGDSTRAQAGKEALYWNFGDDQVWHQGGKEMSYVYPRAGIYQVSVISKDSTLTGCFDTITEVTMRVEASRLITNVITLNDTFFCAPTIINFTDSSYVLVNDSTRTDVTITERLWNFGPQKPESYLRNPSTYYALNGTYKTSLQVKSQQGCAADTVFDIVIIGPQPRFTIVGDTFGCNPFTVKLRNETGKQLAGWIWRFNDVTNQILSTHQDSQVWFTYSTPGTYRIDLVGEDRIYNTVTNTYSNCSETFPYLNNPTDFHPRQITVLKTDTLNIIAKDSICLNETLLLRTTGSQQVTHVTWELNKGTNQEEPLNTSISQQYDSTGKYVIRVMPVITAPQQCVIGTQKEVHVQFPEADFEYDDTGYPIFSFKNRSGRAVRYIWDFGQPSSATNISVEENPSHRYVNENKNVVVCLSAFDNLDCMDSVCKLILLRPSLKIPNVFTPGNYDQANDAFDIEIEGWEKYEAYIYNRWGTLVFEGKTDGVKNDGINWNGKSHNNGSECADGVYYLVFRYKLLNEPDEKIYHGTITLIRDKN